MREWMRWLIGFSLLLVAGLLWHVAHPGWLHRLRRHGAAA